MKQPLVSIAIPSYNYASYIAETIQSALAQDYPTIEVHVIDDGSTDDTKHIVEAIKDSRLHYHYKSNGGLSSARNQALKYIKGAYVTFLDADDIMQPNYVTETFNALQNHPDAAFAYTQMEYFGREERITDFPAYDFEKLKFGSYIHATALIKTDAVKRFGYDESLRAGWEDWDFYLSLGESGLGGILVDQPLLRYRRHDNGSSSMTDELSQAKKQRRLMLAIMKKHRGLYTAKRYWRFKLADVKATVLGR